MKELDTLIALGVQFAILSLFAIGGAMAVVPEMHRQAVDVSHWMTDRQFADLFAIGQAAPGPNIIVVTLIGYQAAGIPGALVATFAMCGPTCVITYYVSRTSTASSTRTGASCCRRGWSPSRSGCSRPAPSWSRAPPTAAWLRSRSRLRPPRLPIGRASIHCGCSRSRACSVTSAWFEPFAQRNRLKLRHTKSTVDAAWFFAFVGPGRGDCAR